MPQVFISYRQLSDAQRQRVRDFGERLRACGVEVVLDQFYRDAHPGGPPEGWPKWSGDQAEKTEKVLIIGNDSWFRCFDGTEKPGDGLGAACEAGIVRQRLYDLAGENEIIRVACFEEADAAGIPLALKRYHRFRAVDDFADLVAWLGDVAPPAPILGPKERSWAWHATLGSRAAGKVSVLACVETFLAVILYWWIAIHWHTHWHLMSSVFIAPLLLLRSPESMKLGVRWFMKDWFGFQDFEKWPKRRRRFCLGLTALLSGIIAGSLVHAVGEWWLTGLSGWKLFGWLLLVVLFSGTLAIASAFASAFAGAFAGDFAGDFAGLFEGEVEVFAVVAVGGAGAGASAVAVPVVVAVAASAAGVGTTVGTSLLVGVISSVLVLLVGVVLGVVVGLAVGFAIRGLVCRMGATLVWLHRGFLRLPGNWKENNFLVDSFVPSELMPGIREEKKTFCFDGWLENFRIERDWWAKWLLHPCFAAFFFLPAFLYRLNIKATCWFWWPLAYLLKPLPKADQAGEQKQALCWPWDNPWQKLLILGPAVVVIGILIYDYCEPTAWLKLKNSAAVPIPLKLILSVEWAHLPLWHWALLLVEVCGLGMLAVAGTACSHRTSENWPVYAQRGMKRDLALMHGLARARSIATGFFLLLGLGMCLISFPPWQKYVPAPVVQGLEEFYHSQDLREQERLQQRAEARKGN